jgi:hypothetical protein
MVAMTLVSAAAVGATGCSSGSGSSGTTGGQSPSGMHQPSNNGEKKETSRQLSGDEQATLKSACERAAALHCSQTGNAQDCEQGVSAALGECPASADGAVKSYLSCLTNSKFECEGGVVGKPADCTNEMTQLATDCGMTNPMGGMMGTGPQPPSTGGSTGKACSAVADCAFLTCACTDGKSENFRSCVNGQCMACPTTPMVCPSI